jgi:cobyrinic acid a,c-diamide synthase
MVAALKGGAGKTFLSVGLASALGKQGYSLAVFKKGPDYIDAGWLGLAGCIPCHNLDAYLFDEERINASFCTHAARADVALVEGNRGLFDGVDAEGTYSSAELAKLLRSPVILVIDVTKMTRTAAALVLGCIKMDPDLHVGGVILNRVGGARHERVLRESIEGATGVPVLGAVRKMNLKHFPQRHLGLLPLQEHPQALEFVAEAGDVAGASINLDRIMDLARTAESLPAAPGNLFPDGSDEPRPDVKIGVLKDSAFQFYYPENLEALDVQGATIVEINALQADGLPELDALYIGGGFPETHAQRLSDNEPFKASLRAAVRDGLPVYAECGGLMYLSRRLIFDEKTYPMVGVFPVDTVLERKPRGHGYIRAEVVKPNPFYPTGFVLVGHEFHYSRVEGLDQAQADCAFRIVRGYGMDGCQDGMHIYNTLATYVHVHALGEPHWAAGILRKASEYRQARTRAGSPATSNSAANPAGYSGRL